MLRPLCGPVPVEDVANLRPPPAGVGIKDAAESRNHNDGQQDADLRVVSPHGTEDEKCYLCFCYFTYLLIYLFLLEASAAT